MHNKQLSTPNSTDWKAVANAYAGIKNSYDDDSNEQDEEETIKQELDELFNRAKGLFKEAMLGWQDIHNDAKDDIRFYNNDQWEDELLSLAKAKRIPAITKNLLPKYVMQIENDLRKQEQSINVHATDESGSDDTAIIFSNHIRSLEQKSNAPYHYIHVAGEQGAMVPGFGFLKAEVDYESEDPANMNQEIMISSVADPFKIICDPSFTHPTAKDAAYWFEWEDYPKQAFRQNWPTAPEESFEVDDILFAPDNYVRVCRFWYKKDTQDVYFLMEDGSVVKETVEVSVIDDEDDEEKKYLITEDDTKLPILRTKRVIRSSVHWCDFTGGGIIDEGDWAGTKFPFSMMVGKMANFDGRKRIQGMIRGTKASQREYNFLASSILRRIGSSNKSPWLVDMASISPYKKIWDKANTVDTPYLPYNAYDATQNGKQSPPPQKADQSAEIQDLILASQKCDDDIKKTLGIFDAGLGATPNEQSGIAIQTLAEQGKNANYHYSDNLTQCLQHFGCILVDLIPKIYDTPRTVRIVGANTKARIIRINELFNDQGKEKLYNYGEGYYGVTINTGPAFATQKQAAIEQMLELMRVNPAIAAYIQHIVARNMDFDGKDEIVDILTKLLAKTNPEMIEGTPQSEVPPEVQAAMQQMKQIITQLSQQMQETTIELQQLQQEKLAKIIEFNNSMALQDKKTQDALLLADKDAQTQQTQEVLRAERDAQNDAAERQIAEINARVAHTEKTMETIAKLVSKLGPSAISMLNMGDTSNDMGDMMPTQS